LKAVDERSIMGEVIGYYTYRYFVSSLESDNRCKVVSCRNNIVWIPIIVVLLTIITFVFWKPYFPVIFLP